MVKLPLNARKYPSAHLAVLDYRRTTDFLVIGHSRAKPIGKQERQTYFSQSAIDV